MTTKPAILALVLASAALAVPPGPALAQRGNAGAGGGTGNASGPTGGNTSDNSTSGVPGQGIPQADPARSGAAAAKPATRGSCSAAGGAGATATGRPGC